MNEIVVVQPSDAIVAVVRSSDDLIEAIVARKNELNLSNSFLEAMGLLSEGYIDKVLGPTRKKHLSPLLLDLLLECLAVELRMVVNMDAVKRMETRWEEREKRNVRLTPNRISKQIIERATPLILQASAKKANTARNEKLSPEHRSRIASKAAKTRWRKQRGKRAPKTPRAIVPQGTLPPQA
jgi:hypothetical protein